MLQTAFHTQLIEEDNKRPVQGTHAIGLEHVEENNAGRHLALGECMLRR